LGLHRIRNTAMTPYMAFFKCPFHAFHDWHNLRCVLLVRCWSSSRPLMEPTSWSRPRGSDQLQACNTRASIDQYPYSS
jgi:hypothetical protein